MENKVVLETAARDEKVQAQIKEAEKAVMEEKGLNLDQVRLNYHLMSLSKKLGVTVTPLMVKLIVEDDEVMAQIKEAHKLSQLMIEVANVRMAKTQIKDLLAQIHKAIGITLTKQKLKVLLHNFELRASIWALSRSKVTDNPEAWEVHQNLIKSYLGIKMNQSMAIKIMNETAFNDMLKKLEKLYETMEE